MKRDNIETYRLPFTIEEVLDELRMTIWCSASQLALLGRSDLADAIIGPETNFGMNETPHSYLKNIDLNAFSITRTVKDGYDFAFQVNDPGRFSGDDWGDLTSFVYGCVRRSWSGDYAPPLMEGSKLVHMADMVQGRMALMLGDALSIRQLALLANMTEAAVRSALSAEGIKTEGRPASLPAETAKVWLRGRRGFIPTADGEAIHDFGSGDAALEAKPFTMALDHMLRGRSQSLAEIAKEANIDVAYLDSLVAGNPAELTVPSLVRLAKVLFADPELFVSSYAKFLASN